MTYTAQSLYDLTAPLFKKHPSAKPYAYFFSPPYVEMEIDKITLTHELILTGHLAKWLAEKEWSYRITQNARDCFCVNRWNEYPTLLHALVAACMEVKE